MSRLDMARGIIGTIGLSASPQSEPCIGCGAMVPKVPDGPVHAYLGTSPGCWALYSSMLGREFSAFDADVHRLSVDTYAIQHPGEPAPQTVQSICAHLVALCLTFEHGKTVMDLRPIMSGMSEGRFFEPKWLEPVPQRYPRTVMVLLDARTPGVYGDRVWEWARTTWDAWTAHHAQVREWAETVLLKSNVR